MLKYITIGVFLLIYFTINKLIFQKRKLLWNKSGIKLSIYLKGMFFSKNRMVTFKITACMYVCVHVQLCVCLNAQTVKLVLCAIVDI